MDLRVPLGYIPYPNRQRNDNPVCLFLTDLLHCQGQNVWFFKDTLSKFDLVEHFGVSIVSRCQTSEQLPRVAASSAVEFFTQGHVVDPLSLETLEQVKSCLSSLKPNAQYPGFHLAINIESNHLYVNTWRIKSSSDSYYCTLAQNVVMLFGLESEKSVRFFAELLLTEMVEIFNAWNKYSAVPVEELKQAGVVFAQ